MSGQESCQRMLNVFLNLCLNIWPLEEGSWNSLSFVISIVISLITKTSDCCIIAYFIFICSLENNCVCKFLLKP